MSNFSIRNPYFIVVLCLAVSLLGITALARMPVDLFPPINLPQVVVATFYSGMPPQDIETNITSPLERFFTMASGIDHIRVALHAGGQHHPRLSFSPAPTPTPTSPSSRISRWPISSAFRPALCRPWS